MGTRLKSWEWAAVQVLHMWSASNCHVDRMNLIIAGLVAGLCLAGNASAQPIVTDGVGRMTAVQSLPFDWTLTLGWPNTTVLAGWPSPCTASRTSGALIKSYASRTSGALMKS